MKLVLTNVVMFLLLFFNIATPMKPFPTLQSIIHENTFKILTAENQINSGILAFQGALFVYLKKNNNLFGSELIEYPIKSYYGRMTHLGLGCAWLSSCINTQLSQCAISDVNSGINLLLLVSSMMHMSNLIYDDALKLLKEENRNYVLDVSIKNSSKYGKCAICYREEPDQGYVSICAQKEHIFCKECLNKCLNIRYKKLSPSNAWCELCRKKIPVNNAILEVTLPPPPKVTLRLWDQQMSFFSLLIYCISLFAFTNILDYQFS